jgi:dTDP-4-amino-4,6-dideoxygalactose transaminase
VADCLRLDRQYGQRVKYVHDTIGHNSRLDTLQAAVLRIKLEELDGWNARRRTLADAYAEALAGTGLGLPEARPEVEHVRHLYVVRTPDRDALLARLHDRGIGAGIHYPVPVHLQAPYRGARTVPEAAPVATRLAGEILSLPLYPEMETAQVERVAREVRAFSAGEGAAPARTATAIATAAG